MKRFYKVVSTRAESGGHAVLLDGKPVKTPGRNPLLAPNAVIADLVMQEWAAQKEKIVPGEMPLTQILSTKIDRVTAERMAMTKTILEYLDTDLLCYRVTHPPDLAQMQKESWDPHLMWFERKFSAPLLTTETLAALTQPEKAHRAAEKFVSELDDNRFTILQLVTALSGSVVLALAFTEKYIDADTVFKAARVEERHKAGIYDEAKYGPDPAQGKKDRAALQDLKAGEQFLQLL